MASSNSIVQGSLPVFDDKLFDSWRIKMLAIFCFQDVAEVVTIGFIEPNKNATEEQKLTFKQQ